jgi:hypothetical protein
VDTCDVCALHEMVVRPLPCVRSSWFAGAHNALLNANDSLESNVSHVFAWNLPSSSISRMDVELEGHPLVVSEQ